MNHSSFEWRMSRRGFLKVALATGAGVTLGKYLGDYIAETGRTLEPWRQGPGIESWRLSICRQCAAGCGMRVRLVDGDAKKPDGNPLCPIARGTLCPKGQAALQALYDPSRLVGPVRRSGPRGAGQWERISWEEALSELQKRLSSLRMQNRPNGLAWISERNDATEGQLIRRFMRAFGSPKLWELVDLRDDSAREASYICQGLDELPSYDFENANYILSFGTPLLEAWFSPTRMTRAYGFLHRGRQNRRGRLVQIESRLSPTAIKADEWVPIRPGTEAALALGIAHELIREDLYDHSFVQEHGFGFEDWIDAEGKTQEGLRSMILREYVPYDVAKLTGVPVTTILRLARELTPNKPSLVVGEQRPYSGGISLAWAVHILNGLLGMIDRPGGVLSQLSPALQKLPDFELDDIAKRGLENQAQFNTARGRERPYQAVTISLLGISLLGISLLGQTSMYPLEVLFLSSSLGMSAAPERQKFLKALEKVPFVVSFSTSLDDTCAFADLILPDHSSFEKWVDVVPLPTDAKALWGVTAPALEPLLETKATGDIVLELGRRLGGSIGSAFPWKDMSEVLRFSAQGLFEARRGGPYASSYDESWLRQLETGGWWLPTAKTFDEFWTQLLDAGGWYDPIYRYEEWRRVFQTQTGKFEFASQTLWKQLHERNGARDVMPKYNPPELAGNEDQFPLILKPFTVLTTAGLQDPNQPFLLETLAPQIYGRWEDWVELHPKTAAALGIVDNELVWLESPLGRVKISAKIYAGAIPDVAAVLVGHRHWAGGEFVRKEQQDVADIIPYRVDSSLLPLMISTRVKVSKVSGGV